MDDVAGEAASPFFSDRRAIVDGWHAVLNGRGSVSHAPCHRRHLMRVKQHLQLTSVSVMCRCSPLAAPLYISRTSGVSVFDGAPDVAVSDPEPANSAFVAHRHPMGSRVPPRGRRRGAPGVSLSAISALSGCALSRTSFDVRVYDFRPSIRRRVRCVHGRLSACAPWPAVQRHGRRVTAINAARRLSK